MDIDQARIRISLKNDQINNLRASIKTTEIRSSLKMADFQYKINQLENKVAASQAKYLKQQQSFKKQKNYYEQQVSKLQIEIGRLKKVNENNQILGKQKERQFKGAIYEQQMKIEKEKEANYRLSSQIEVLHKYFQPKKVMTLLKKQKLEEVPTYSQLHSRYTSAQQNLEFANKQMSTMKSQTMSEIETSFNALNTYESVMYELRVKNDELRQEVVEKELQLQSHCQEKDKLEAVQQETSTQIEQLNQQLIVLRRQLQFYQNEETKYSTQDEVYAEQIQVLEKKLQKKQMECEIHMSEYQEKFVSLEEQNRVLRTDLEELQILMKQNQESNHNLMVSVQLQLENKCNVIALLNESLKDREELIVELKKENDHMVNEINGLLRSKRKMSEDIRLNEDMFKSKFSILNEEIELMKCQIDIVTNENEVKMTRAPPGESYSNGSNSEKNAKILKRMMSGQSAFKGAISPQMSHYPQNLLLDLNDRINLQDAISNADLGNYEQDSGWHEKYLNLLQKHNEFSQKVFVRLRALSTKK